MTKELTRPSTEVFTEVPAIYSVADVQAMAAAIVQGGLFPHLKTPQAALSLMLLCQAEGLHPMLAVQRYHIVQGRPVMRSDAMLAAFQQRGGRVEWHERSAQLVAATFSHPSGGSCSVEWSIEQAKAAGLTGKEVWRQYPRQMLTARVISEGVRTVFPGVCMGLYTPEEAENMPPVEVPRDRQPQVVDPEREVAVARADFFRTCRDRGHDVFGEDGRPDKGKTLALLATCFGYDTADLAIPSTAAGWQAATEAVRVMSSVEEVVVDAVGEELTDPFLEGEE